MARPVKQGLDYFNTPVNFLKDRKVRKIKRACGANTIEVLICLFSNIYEDRGYYIEWDEDVLFDVADDVDTQNGTVTEIVNRAMNVELFDKKLFEKYKIITSKDIQEFYIFATSKRKYVEMDKRFLLAEKINSNINLINDNINSINEGRSTQSKVKESKVNKTKVNDSNAVVTNTSSNNRDSGLNENKSPHQQLFDFYAENFPSTSTFVIQNIEYDADDYGDELVLYAMQKAVLKNVSNYKYVQGILNGWERDGVKSVEQAKTQETNFKAKTAVKGNNDDDPRNKGLAPDDPNYRPGCSGYTNAELKARHERLGW
ncbi:Lin1244/Lin1753 domain-containing protein [Pediococcus pentosaceus]|uniref:Lin1244/Lin1753 domain-containing protein n=1 Tax=Pediococcus pentosaceus TaxID=1255 RepID=UPI0020C04E41|nr:Lin1244/Lin1753 domain-containing protein [Pediococcus pentosaceus]